MQFPSTRWSRILRVTGPEGTRDPDLDALARTYWRPVQAWLRARAGYHESEADDAAQDFFVWLIERERLADADPARGRFRSLLKTMLRHFAIDRERRRAAAKRGGAQTHVPLAEPGADSHSAEPISPEPAPDVALDAAWRAELVARATDRLEQELRAAGRAMTFALFRDYFLAPEEGVDYRTLAARHGVSTTAVSNDLMLAKRRLRALLRDEVSETVADPETLEDELHWLFGATPS